MKRKSTGEVVAEVRMDEKGIIFPQRVAVATDVRSRRTIAETRDEKKGVIFEERVARTYAKDSGKRTHESRNVTEGIIFTRHVTETTPLDKPNVRPTVTSSAKRGLFFIKRFFSTNKR